MDIIEEKYTIKTGIIRKLEVYLGADIGKIYQPEGYYTCKMRSDSYVKVTVNNSKKIMKSDGCKFNNNLSEVNYSPQNQFPQ